MTQTTFTLGQAAKAVDYAKSKISNDIKQGTLSAARSEPNGAYSIDGSELARVYGSRFKPERLKDRSQTDDENASENGGERSRTGENPQKMLEEIALLKAQLSMAETMREAERQAFSGRIEDLRASLTDAQGQRDRAMTLLTEQIAVTKQLTDQRPKEGGAIPMPGPQEEPARAAAGGKGRGFLGLFRGR